MSDKTLLVIKLYIKRHIEILLAILIEENEIKKIYIFQLAQNRPTNIQKIAKTAIDFNVN